MTGTGKRILVALLFIPWALPFFTPAPRALAARALAASERIINVSASVDSGEIGILDTVTLSVSVETENISRLPKPRLPDMKAFTVLNESTQSQTSISIVNGKTSRTKTVVFTYVLQPTSEGSFLLGPVVFEHGSNRYSTDPVSITVKSGSRRRTGPSAPADLQVDPEKLAQDIFIRVDPGSGKIFEGEQLPLSYKLYSRLDIDSISLKQNPSFQGFYIEDLFNATKLDYQKEEYEGRVYTTSRIKEVVLFPLKPGRYTPEPLVLQARVIVTSDDVFDIFGRPYTFNLSSNDVEVEVAPLPPTPDLSSFSGIVGDLEVDITSPSRTVETGETVTVYLTLKSTGNINLINDPGLQLSHEGRIYLSDTIQEKTNGDKVWFVKKFEYTLIPRKSGKLTVASPDFTFFDTKTGQYVLTGTDPLVLTVMGEDIGGEKPIRSRKDAVSAGGISFIKRDVKILHGRPSPLSTPFYYLYHLVISVLLASFVVYRIRREKLEKNEGLLKMKRARRQALTLLTVAEEQLLKKRPGDALGTVHRAVVNYIGDKTGTRPQDVTAKTIDASIDGVPGITAPAKAELRSLFDACMLYRFSNAGSTNDAAVRELIQRSVDLIGSLERTSRQNGGKPDK